MFLSVIALTSNLFPGNASAAANMYVLLTQFDLQILRNLLLISNFLNLQIFQLFYVDDEIKANIKTKLNTYQTYFLGK